MDSILLYQKIILILGKFTIHQIIVRSYLIRLLNLFGEYKCYKIISHSFPQNCFLNSFIIHFSLAHHFILLMFFVCVCVCLYVHAWMQIHVYAHVGEVRGQQLGVFFNCSLLHFFETDSYQIWSLLIRLDCLGSIFFSLVPQKWSYRLLPLCFPPPNGYRR